MVVVIRKLKQWFKCCAENESKNNEKIPFLTLATRQEQVGKHFLSPLLLNNGAFFKSRVFCSLSPAQHLQYCVCSSGTVGATHSLQGLAGSYFIHYVSCFLHFLQHQVILKGISAVRAVFATLFPSPGRSLPIKSGKTLEVGVMADGFWPITLRLRKHRKLLKDLEKLLAKPWNKTLPEALEGKSSKAWTAGSEEAKWHRDGITIWFPAGLACFLQASGPCLHRERWLGGPLLWLIS